MIGLTAVQSKTFGFVRDCLVESGIAPSYQEIAAHVGLTSKGRVSRIIDDLVERGAIVRIPRKTRALGLPEPGVGTGFVVHPLPEVRRAIEAYARENHISVKTAAEEALRVYFVEAAAG